MKQKSPIQQPQADVSEQEEPVSQPQTLDPSELEKVSGGLPRGGGGWVSNGGTVEIDQLPRGGGGW